MCTSVISERKDDTLLHHLSLKKNKDIHILFGLRIKELRVRAHISQEELSFRSGLSKNYISDVERGTRNISLKAISKLADGLKVEVKELFNFSK